ncbi:trace amine-associated receptor 9 isoform X1 [Bombus vosnesenskii]|uniref:Trace amine-associated receptor 9 isoform X1 n=1 Tax=Bombus vosnesenskii TaxID=207650 RepID=A0A6J3KXI9_9HYME|nr:trace amine-associated receptor 9 isoform X1 [Bombus vosnesenskii]XP_033356871.1 trace amine-associated receptor 9 isoform X1 [Bombus vosnesenskii]
MKRDMEHKQTILLAPALSNSSCWRRDTSEGTWTGPGPGELLRAALILALSLGILCANLLVICVINSRRYSKYIHAQPKYLLTSLASNDLAIGLLVTPFGFLPAVYGCWPYGEVVCQIQALLRGALTQQSAVILVCMAIDRYVCMLHPHHYHKHTSKKYYMRQGCVAVMSTTWIASVAIFGALVLPRGGYYFNGSGLLACDPFFARASLRILACCCFYFPTTMVLMYCYGSAFHVNKLRLKRVVCVNTPEVVSGGHMERLVAHERRLSTSASRTMAAMSLGFIVMVTPWTIQEVVAACTGSKPPPFLDFLATWLALSNSFWNPFLYWLLNNHFRRISRELLYTKVLCRPKPLGPKQHCCATSTGGLDVCSMAGVDLSGLERCSIDRFSMARCSSSSLANTPPPLPWETGHVLHNDATPT